MKKYFQISCSFTYFVNEEFDIKQKILTREFIIHKTKKWEFQIFSMILYPILGPQGLLGASRRRSDADADNEFEQTHDIFLQIVPQIALCQLTCCLHSQRRRRGNRKDRTPKGEKSISKPPNVSK